MASPAVASPSRSPADTTAPSPASPPRRLASSPPAVDASAVSSPASAHSGELSGSNASSSLLASRSEEYRLLFRLPPDEVIVQDFNCALQENILLQGHMYLFLHHICFYSNIFGYETKKTIPLQDVTDVRKAKTAAIFPNAIEIIAGAKRHFFGSFLSRDESYRIIVDGWEQHISVARLLLERQDTKSASDSDENGHVLLEEAKESKQDDSSPLDRCANGTAVMSGSADSGDSDISISERFSKVPENGAEDNSTELNPFSLGPFDDDAPDVLESYTLITESKFQVPVEVLFNVLMSDGAFGFLDDCHKKCGDKEFRCSPWRLDDQGLVWDVSFLHPIKIYLGAKFGACPEVQKLRVYKNRHIVIQTSQQIGDAPHGDHFTVEGHDLLKQESSSRSKGASSSTNADDQSGDSVPDVTSAPDVPGVRSPVPPIQGHQQSIGRDSIASTSQELWSSLASYMRSRQFGPVLAVTLVAIIILLQITIIVLLTRSPKVYMVSHEAAASSLGSYSKESIEWAQKRLSSLGEERRMRMAWLKSHLDDVTHLHIPRGFSPFQMGPTVTPNIRNKTLSTQAITQSINTFNLT